VEEEEYRRRAATANFISPRRYIYWARYLHEHGRHEAALPEIDRRLAEAPGDSEALALRAEVLAALGRTEPEPTVAVAPAVAAGDLAPGWILTPEARSQLVANLSAQPPGTSTWIVYDGRYDSAQAFAKQLAAVFEEAQWQVRQLGAVDFAMKPGLFVFAADEPPSSGAETVSSALAAAPFGATTATGYREFVEERRRADPNWRGFSMTPEQGFILAVGRPPG
jgi:hypothetical protein